MRFLLIAIIASLVSGCTAWADIFDKQTVDPVAECKELYDSADPFTALLPATDASTEALTNELAQRFVGEGPRRLVVFMDGTGATPRNQTNIWRLYTLAAKAGCAGERVVPHYFRGVGTDPLNRLRGGSVGNGLDTLIRQGYRFLSKNYREGDQIYIFGFSRGAYAARSLNGFIEFVGLADASRTTIDPDLVGELYRFYHRKNKGWHGWEDAFREEIRRKVDRDGFSVSKVRVKAIGVFDTVAALGLERDDFPDDHRTDLYAEIGVHALSIDEQRDDFRDLRFDERVSDGQQLVQAWFAGGHSDVGGGYRDGTLELLTLQWMMEQVQMLSGERLFADFEADPGTTDCALGPLHDEFLDREEFKSFGLHRRRIASTDQIDASVHCRLRAAELPAPHRKCVAIPADEAPDGARRFLKPDGREVVYVWRGREPNGIYEPENLHGRPTRTSTGESFCVPEEL